MKKTLISGIAAGAIALAAGAATASDSFSALTVSKVGIIDMTANGAKPGGMKPGIKPGWSGPKPGMSGPKPGWSGPKPGWSGPKPGWNGGGHRWGHKVGGKWGGGWKAPGGWNGYQRPHRGFTVNRYWINPSFSLGNYWLYGLSAPSNGYYWSRYYDDAVLMNNQGYVTDYRSNIDWNQYEGGYAPESYDQGEFTQPEYAPSMSPDNQAYDWGDNGTVGFAAPDGSHYRYDGGWVEGEFIDPEQRVWEGDWEGRVYREGGNNAAVAGAPYAPAPQAYAPAPQVYAPPQAYHVPRGYEGYEKCLKSSGLTGGVIGALIGGIAGNQIAGRGDKLGGTLLGAGVGGLAGVGIEKATSKCKKHVPGYREPVSYAPPPQYYPPQPAPQYYPPTYQSGYYYYPQPQITTVTVVPGNTVTTTTTTEEYYYESVPVAPKKRYVAKKRYVKPKPRCVCR